MYGTPSPSHIPQVTVETTRGPASSGTVTRPLARRPRDFGVGYGRSSGYASPRSYAVPQAPYFRCR